MAAQGADSVMLGPVAKNGFPARGLTSRLPDSTSGEWLLAYQAEQTKYLRAMFASVRSTFQRNMAVAKEPSVADEIPQFDNSPILDKAFILKHCYVKDPHDLYVCNINGCELNRSVPEDFQEFDAVEEVNANDNKLTFETFATFPNMQELEISLNHIKDITFHSSNFTHLQVLNISYNILSDSAILTLGLLPNLKELHLTGNDIVALPLEMSRAVIEAKEDGNSGLQLRYPSLEKLWLDDNKLTDLSTFAILAGLRKLKMLNLDNNEIYSIPQLKLLGADNLQKAHGGLQDPQTKDTFLTQSTTQPDNADLAELNNTALRGSLRPSQINLNQTQFSLAPFPCLKSLSIANNMIIAPEGLVAVSSWPSLNTLIVHGNPVTRFNKGMPPLLKSELIDPFGIKIVRHVPGPVQKSKVAEKAPDFVKVSQEPPPVIPRQPLLAIEPSHSILDEDVVSLSSSSTNTLGSPYVRTYPHTPYDSVVLSNDSLQERRPTTVGPSGRTDMLLQAVVPLDKPKKRLPLAIAHRADPNSVTQSQFNDDLLQDSVFITQVRDDGVPTPRPYPPHDDDSVVEESITVEEEYKRNLRRTKEKWKNIPDKFKGFEALLESDSEDDETIPSDIARCTRALKHALDHPLLLADSSKLKHRQLSGGRQYLRRKSNADIPRPKALPSKVKEVQQVLHSIKNNCNTLETNLSTVLGSPNSTEKSNKTLKKESKDLLKEIQLKYANVRKKSLRTTSELSASLK